MKIIKYKALDKNNPLQAFLSLLIPKWGGFIIHDIKYFVKDNKRWINLPQEVYEDEGKKKYKNLNTFEDPKMTFTFQCEVIKLIDEYLKTNSAVLDETAPLF